MDSFWHAVYVYWLIDFIVSQYMRISASAYLIG